MVPKKVGRILERVIESNDYASEDDDRMRK